MMDNNDFEAVRRIVEQETNDRLSGCDEEHLARLEETLHTRFPAVYRRYLEEYNGGDFFDGAFSLFSVPASQEQLKPAENLGVRNMPGTYAELSVPQEYLVIGIFNFGDLICLDPETGRVFQWDVENDDAFLEYSDFLDFLTEAEADFLPA